MELAPDWINHFHHEPLLIISEEQCHCWVTETLHFRGDKNSQSNHTHKDRNHSITDSHSLPVVQSWVCPVTVIGENLDFSACIAWSRPFFNLKVLLPSLQMYVLMDTDSKWFWCKCLTKIILDYLFCPKLPKVFKNQNKNQTQSSCIHFF